MNYKVYLEIYYFVLCLHLH